MLDDVRNDNIFCEWETEAVWTQHSTLEPGAARTHAYEIDCDVSSGSGSTYFKSTVCAARPDLRPNNDTSSRFVTVNA